MHRSVDSGIKGRGITVGTFDGVHRGHKAVVEYLLAESERRSLEPMVVTFDPHPLTVVAPERAPLLLENAGERENALRAMGVKVEVIPFTEELRRLTVAEWFDRLIRDYDARLVVTGFDNTFGSDGMGMSVAEYVRIGAGKGLEVTGAPQIKDVSSTLIRRALGAGDVEAANEMLGYKFSFTGTVGHGKGLGHTIGVPTANAVPPAGQLIPAPGVYAADAVTGDGRKIRAVVNIGVAPTVAKGLPLTVEAHLIDFTGNLYDSSLRLEFLRRLRDERRFDSLDDLRGQIARDMEAAKV